MLTLDEEIREVLMKELEMALTNIKKDKTGGKDGMVEPVVRMSIVAVVSQINGANGVKM